MTITQQQEQLPKTMKAAQGKDYGDIDEMLSVQDGVEVPDLKDDNSDIDNNNKEMHGLIKMATRQDRQTHMLIRTLAVALAPGDVRVLSGKTRRLQGPPRFPYIPGADCCGVVVQTNPKDKYFQVGDVVAARFTVAPRDAMCEYARVSTTVCEKVDISKINPIEAACLASASPVTIVADFVLNKKKNAASKGERILILGAGGGIGSHLCQLLSSEKGSSSNSATDGAAVSSSSIGYICGTGSNPKRLLEAPLSCDDAVDYTQEDIFASKKYQEDPFDTIVDLSCGGWLKLLESRRLQMPPIVKPASQGGRYMTITSDVPVIEATSLWPLVSTFMLKPLWRTIWSRLSPFSRRSMPTFNQVNGLPSSRDVMTRTLALAHQGKLKAVVDGPYPFTTLGVRHAFRKLESRHANGKVVVKIADLTTKE